MRSRFLHLFLVLSVFCLAIAHAQDADDDRPVPKAQISLSHDTAKVRLYEPDDGPP